jgi:predicted ATP-dependent endonuclease of OLD family
MTITNLKIENYKSLKNVEVKVSDFTCIIGENNAGKSTFIEALLLFIKGNKLKKEVFYDTSKDILITVTFEHIIDSDLEVLEEIHREKLQKYIVDGKLKLARRYCHKEYSSKLRNVKFVPILAKFQKEKIDDYFKGKKKDDIQSVLKTIYHEIDKEKILEVSTQKGAKELIAEYIESLPLVDLEEKDTALDSGIDNTIRAFFPEPIYIPAVKDLTDDMKTKESASFGKLLNILLDVIEEDLNEAQEVFNTLREKLNRVYDENGKPLSDKRIQRVIDIESTIQRNLNETFKNVSIELEVPPPEIKTILSSATIVANDGVRGSIENKGDGFKRAITFSILRSYVELSYTKDWQKEENKSKQKDKFLFLFEEPELYLHPNAQNILFEALALISKNHQVLVTTHSPLFFAPEKTKTFIKIKKESEVEKPYSIAKYIDLENISKKDQSQLISFETSDYAFFSKKIVLVEGDSELIVLPHIAKLISSEYDFRNKSISLVKTGGKGSFKRYKEFFEKFDIEIFMIADLDVLIDGFEKFESSQNIKDIHSKLMTEVSLLCKDIQQPKSRKYKDELSKNKNKSLYEQIKNARKEDDSELVLELLDEIFSFESKNTKLEILKKDFDNKTELLEKLRVENIFVLSQGDIESYYPEEIVRSKIDKPTMAYNYRKNTKNKEDVVSVCKEFCDNKIEFEVIFEKIFGKQKVDKEGDRDE